MTKQNNAFNGSDYKPELDEKRLTTQIQKIFNIMKDGEYRGLTAIKELLNTNAGEASVSAQLRNLRKTSGGSHELLKKRTGEPKNGYWIYKIIENKKEPIKK